MNTDGVEIVDDNAIGGADSVTVNDLTGTDVTQTNVDLAGAFGGIAGDGAADSVDVNATNGVDNINIQGNGSGADVTGLATAVSVKHADTTDHLNCFARKAVLRREILRGRCRRRDSWSAALFHHSPKRVSSSCRRCLPGGTVIGQGTR